MEIAQIENDGSSGIRASQTIRPICMNPGVRKTLQDSSYTFLHVLRDPGAHHNLRTQHLHGRLFRNGGGKSISVNSENPCHQLAIFNGTTVPGLLPAWRTAFENRNIRERRCCPIPRHQIGADLPRPSPPIFITDLGYVSMKQETFQLRSHSACLNLKICFTWALCLTQAGMIA